MELVLCAFETHGFQMDKKETAQQATWTAALRLPQASTGKEVCRSNPLPKHAARARCQDSVAELSLKSTAMTDVCMDVVWEVMDSIFSRAKRARTEFFKPGPLYSAQTHARNEARNACQERFPELFQFLK